MLNFSNDFKDFYCWKLERCSKRHPTGRAEPFRVASPRIFLFALCYCILKPYFHHYLVLKYYGTEEVLNS